MTDFIVLAVVGTATTVAWSWKVPTIMIACNLVAIAIGKPAIQNRGVGPTLPVPMPAMFEGFGLPELLATACLGHILGVGMILGLASSGSL
ncbi:MAG: photosystem I reaction center subunit PsaK [Coleofasciculaceae cyanobacterium SM2_3_26]|nr:photosystem I reaction center subunit PsaK [Coleofasciculaceae cyanobacterium SM2_3_26]